MVLPPAPFLSPTLSTRWFPDFSLWLPHTILLLQTPKTLPAPRERAGTQLPPGDPIPGLRPRGPRPFPTPTPRSRRWGAAAQALPGGTGGWGAPRWSFGGVWKWLGAAWAGPNPIWGIPCAPAGFFSCRKSRSAQHPSCPPELGVTAGAGTWGGAGGCSIPVSPLLEPQLCQELFICTLELLLWRGDVRVPCKVRRCHPSTRHPVSLATVDLGPWASLHCQGGGSCGAGEKKRGRRSPPRGARDAAWPSTAVLSASTSFPARSRFPPASRARRGAGAARGSLARRRAARPGGQPRASR